GGGVGGVPGAPGGRAGGRPGGPGGVRHAGDPVAGAGREQRHGGGGGAGPTIPAHPGPRGAAGAPPPQARRGGGHRQPGERGAGGAGLTRRAIWERLPDEVRRNEKLFIEALLGGVDVLWRREERPNRAGGSRYRLGVED